MENPSSFVPPERVSISGFEGWSRQRYTNLISALGRLDLHVSVEGEELPEDLGLDDLDAPRGTREATRVPELQLTTIADLQAFADQHGLASGNLTRGFSRLVHYGRYYPLETAAIQASQEYIGRAALWYYEPQRLTVADARNFARFDVNPSLGISNDIFTSLETDYDDEEWHDLYAAMRYVKAGARLDMRSLRAFVSGPHLQELPNIGTMGVEAIRQFYLTYIEGSPQGRG